MFIVNFEQIQNNIGHINLMFFRILNSYLPTEL